MYSSSRASACGPMGRSMAPIESFDRRPIACCTNLSGVLFSICDGTREAGWEGFLISLSVGQSVRPLHAFDDFQTAGKWRGLLACRLRSSPLAAFRLHFDLHFWSSSAAAANNTHSRRTASNTIVRMPRTASSRKKASAAAASAAAAAAEPEEYSDNEEMAMMFSQHMPEMSQAVPEAKDREKQNLDSLDPHVREKLLTTLSRLLLFKALAGETIDKVSESMGI